MRLTDEAYRPKADEPLCKVYPNDSDIYHNDVYHDVPYILINEIASILVKPESIWPYVWVHQWQ